MNFSTLGLSPPLLTAVTEQGYENPSPIQIEAIPAILQGRDLMAASQTGTGKTASFALPLLQLLSQGVPAPANQVRCLILVPTRELASQVSACFVDLGKHLPLRSMVVFGGVKINPQMMRLRKGADILVATPGRLLDLCSQNAIKFNHLEALVLDEADRMLDMGFVRDIQKIIALLPKKRQNLMFSATFSGAIRVFAKTLVRDPVEISISPSESTAKTITQCIYPVDKAKKSELLLHLLSEKQWYQVLVFTRTKHGADRLQRFLAKSHIKSAAIHGNKNQGARTRALVDFKSGSIQVLVATDIAARGLDIEQLPQVVNFDLPNVPEDYVHRIGRTGRAGHTGQAISLVSMDELEHLKDIERLIQEILPRQLVDKFEPSQVLPLTHLGMQPQRSLSNKPKQSQKNGRNHWATRIQRKK